MAIVQLGITPEDVCLEFKERIELSHQHEKQRIKQKLEFCRDVSQFANTDGGCLLVGVSEMTDPSGGVTVAGEVVGVANVEVLRQQVEDVIGLYLVPSTFRRSVVPIVVPDRGTVLAINILASERPVVVWNRREGWSQCYRRTAFGKSALNPVEFEDLLMDHARSMRLRLARMLADGPAFVMVHSEVWEESGRNNWTGDDEQVHVNRLRDYQAAVSVVGESEFTVVLTYKNGKTAAINVPYGFIEEVWFNEAGLVTISLTRKLGLGLDGRLFLERRPR